MAVRTSPRKAPGPEPKRTSRSKRKAKRGFFRRFWWLFIVVPLVLALGIVGTLVYIYVRLPLPTAPPPVQTTFIYDAQGNVLTALHAAEDRTVIPFADMPEHLKRAVIAVEDKNFYDHPGISVMAILRAGWADLTNRDVVQGGSTITQQYVKTVFTGGERSIIRKIKEAMLALKLENQFSKDEILSKYLNTIYFGHGAYGVQAAAQTYFGVDAKDLNLLQSATLAGLIQAPGRFDPIDHPADSEIRRDYALEQMILQGYLERERGERLGDQPVKTVKDTLGNAPAAYFVTATKKWLESEFGQEATFGGGLRVTTTLNMDWQRAAEEAVGTYLTGSDEEPSAALVAIDPRNGAVRAMVGDARHMGRARIGLFNLATQARRQTGSAFKTFTLAAAMEDRISLDSTWNGPSQIEIDDPRCATEDEETQQLGPWEPINAGDSGVGTMSLLSATALSVNTIYAQLVVQVDPADVAEIARRMGIRSELKPVCAITLGSEDVTVLDMATAYATLAARGVHREPRLVAKVEYTDGNLVRPRSEGRRALDENDADLVTYALEGVIERGTGTAADIGRPAAGKTGTAHDATNAYFCGYVVQLVTCVWVGFPAGQIPMQNVAGFPEVYGGTIPARIWHDFMIVATEGMEVLDFPEPSFEGYDGEAINAPPSTSAPPPSPTPTESPSPEPTETETPTESSPSPEPTETETPPPSTEPPPTEPPPPTTEAPPPTTGPAGPESPGREGGGAATSAAWTLAAVLVPSLLAGGLRRRRPGRHPSTRVR